MENAHNNANPRMRGLITSENYDLFIQAVVEGAMENDVPESVIGEFGAILTGDGLKSVIIQGWLFFRMVRDQGSVNCPGLFSLPDVKTPIHDLLSMHYYS